MFFLSFILLYFFFQKKKEKKPLCIAFILSFFFFPVESGSFCKWGDLITILGRDLCVLGTLEYDYAEKCFVLCLSFSLWRFCFNSDMVITLMLVQGSCATRL